MDRKKLLFYYWGLLEGDEAKEVKEYLSNPKNEEEYESLKMELDYLFPSVESEDYKRKSIPFESVKIAYQKKLAKKERKKSIILFSSLIAAFLLVFIFLFLFVNKESSISPDSGKALRISFIESKIYLFDENGEIKRLSKAGDYVYENYTLYTPFKSSAVLSIPGAFTLRVNADTQIVFKEISQNKNEIYCLIELTKGKIKVEKKDNIPSTIHFESERVLLKSSMGAFSLERTKEGERLKALKAEHTFNTRLRYISSMGERKEIRIKNPINSFDVEINEGESVLLDYKMSVSSSIKELILSEKASPMHLRAMLYIEDSLR